MLPNPQITRGIKLPVSGYVGACWTRQLASSLTYACRAWPVSTLQRRTRLERPALPVILISAHYDDAIRQRALQGGAKEFFYRPFDAAALLSAIDQALAER